MISQSQNLVTLYISYRSVKPIFKAELPQEDGSLLWLQDSMDVVPRGKHLYLRLQNNHELWQVRRFFPSLAVHARTTRFRTVLEERSPKRLLTQRRQTLWRKPNRANRLLVLPLVTMVSLLWQRLAGKFQMG